MGTQNPLAARDAARLTTSFLLLFMLAALQAPRLSATEFGMLVENFDPDSASGLTLTAQGDEDADGLEMEDDDPDADGLFRVIDRQLPKIEGGHFNLPPLSTYTLATENIGNGRLPESFREDNPSVEIALPESASERGQPWNWSVAQWAATNTFSYPLYFEDRMLERHGHVRFGHLQPVASATRFFATGPMLPYLMTIDSPCDCEYKLGHYRSGSCAPKMIQRPPRQRNAIVAEALFLGGAIAIFP